MNSGSPYKPSLILFATLPVACFLLFGFHGMDAADRGFIPALAYRILSGEVMYHDFFYVRPPLSPYFHTIEMALLPESWEMIGYRFVYYWFMWLPIYWSIRSLERYFDFGKMGVSPWILGAIAYVLSLHNFFAAPWHTLDGIFFAALGLYFITRSPGLLTNAVGLFCMGLAALTKQPFGIVPLWESDSSFGCTGGNVPFLAARLPSALPAWASESSSGCLPPTFTSPAKCCIKRWVFPP